MTGSSTILVSMRTGTGRAAVTCVLLSLLLNGGCLGSVFREHGRLHTLAELERTPSLDPRALKDVNVLALGSDARRFIDSRTRDSHDTYGKIRALRRAVFAKNGLDFHFDNDLTLNAEDTFRHAGGNCLALANFFVAAVRYLGYDAVYQEVKRQGLRREVSADGDSYYVIELHVNVSGDIEWGTRRARYVLDYLAVPREDFNNARIISDQRALAHYYNNIAMQLLAADDAEVALQYLKKAVLADPDVPFVWSNLGVLYSRRGDLEAAEFAYQRALSLDRDQPSALSNLALLREKMQAAGDADPQRGHSG